MKKYLIFAFLTLFITQSLFSQEEKNDNNGSKPDQDKPGLAYKKGDFTLFLRGGPGKPQGDDFDILTDTSLYEIESFINIASINQNRRILGILQNQSLEKNPPEASAYNASLGFEYGMNKFLGVGISLNTAKAEVKNIKVSSLESLLVNPYFLILGGFCTAWTCPSGEPGIFDYMTLFDTEAESYNINTIDFHLNFHFFTQKNFDPFIRIDLGLGSIPGGTVAKAGLATGFRYIFNSGFFLSTELLHSSYNLQYPETDDSAGGSTTWQISAINIGLGYAFK